LKVWGYDYDGSRSIDIAIHKIKNKLQGTILHVKTKRGKGYYIEDEK
jgi:DNA-binding response OmpR family regulator